MIARSGCGGFCVIEYGLPSTHTLFALLAADTALPRIQGILHTGHLTGHTSRYLTHEGDTLSPSNTSFVATPLSL